MVDESIVKNVLATIVLPHVGLDLVSLQAIQNIDFQEGILSIKVRLAYPAKRYHAILTELITSKCSTIPGVSQVIVEISSRIYSYSAQQGLKSNRGIKNIIAIASGKGGVGKSTVACNLALAIQAEGGVVGILDADIHGPSQPWMLGVKGRKPKTVANRIEPIEAYGLKSMSMGYLVEEDTPMIWRGPMISSALQQLLNDSNWGELDYLIIDLPPGTGDIQLTLSQKIPVSGAVIITTPQDIALLDAQKAFMMFKKVGVTILGVIENMGIYTCTHCGHQAAIFGEEGAVKLKEKYDIALLGNLPLDIRIREQGDKGVPIVIAEPEGTVADMYYELGRRVTGALSLRPRDLSLMCASRTA